MSFRQLALPLTFSALLLASCGSEDAKPAAPQAQAPRPVSVEVMTVSRTDVESTRILSGRARAYAEAEIRPQVTGLIQKRLFTEGQAVEEGDALYQIEASEYRAIVESARADLKGAEAKADAARETAKRFERLAEINAVSRQDYDEAVAAMKSAEAQIGIKQAALSRARIDEERTRVRSPIAGRIGRSNVTPGALVTANQAEPLARVLRLDPIYIDLTAASAAVQKWRRDVAGGLIETGPSGSDIPVTIRFEDNSTHPYMGDLEFSEVNVDESAGTVIIRAVVPNPDAMILPGMFVKAEFSAGELNDIFLIPQSIVQRTPRGDAYVYAVAPDGTAEQKTLTIEGTKDAQWVVTGGLEEGDKLLTSGFQSVRVGSALNIVNAE